MSSILDFPNAGPQHRTADDGDSPGISKDLLARLDQLQQFDKARKDGALDGLSSGNVRDIADALHDGRTGDALRILEAARLVADGVFSSHDGTDGQTTILRDGAFRYEQKDQQPRARLTVVHDEPADLAVEADRKTQSLNRVRTLTSCHNDKFKIASGAIALSACHKVDLSGYAEIMLVLFAGNVSVRNTQGKILAEARAKTRCCAVLNIQAGQSTSDRLFLHHDDGEAVSALWVAAKGARLALDSSIHVSAPIQIAAIPTGQSLVSGLDRARSNPSGPHAQAEADGAFSRYTLSWNDSPGQPRTLPTLLTNSDKQLTDVKSHHLVGHPALEALIVFKGGLYVRGIDRELEHQGEIRDSVSIPVFPAPNYDPPQEWIEEELFTASADATSCDVILLDSEKGHDVSMYEGVPSLALHKIFNCPIRSVKESEESSADDKVVSINARAKK
jgi:hypothetical protein